MPSDLLALSPSYLLIQGKLSYFYEMIRCCYDIGNWVYSPQLVLEKASGEDPVYGSDLIKLLRLTDCFRARINEQLRSAFLVEAPFDLVFLCGILYEEESPRQIQLYGPVFTGSSSPLTLRKYLDDSGVFGSRRDQLYETWRKLPVLPFSTLTQYGQMLHYALTGTRIATLEIPIFLSSPLSPSKSNQAYSDDNPSQGGFESSILKGSHAGVWQAEQQLIRMIQEGNMGYMAALEQSMKLSSGVKADFKDPLRTAKNNVLTLITLVSRAAIMGGLSPELAYSLNDFYAERCEDSRSISAVMTLSSQLIEDYVTRVHERKISNGISREILESTTYISLHLSEPLNIPQLAAAAGYSDYYFSQKFKKEMGISVSEYIAKARIDLAKNLLKGTHQSLADIQESIGISSRSRFYELFKKYTGLSPAEYRSGK